MVFPPLFLGFSRTYACILILQLYSPNPSALQPVVELESFLWGVTINLNHIFKQHKAQEE